MPVVTRSPAAPLPGSPSAALPPAITVTVSSNAPKGMTQIYSKVTHEWNPTYVNPTKYFLHLDVARAKPTKAKPVTWRVESLENRFLPLTLIQNGLEAIIPGRKGVIAQIPSAGPVKVTATGVGAAPLTRTVNLKDYLVVSIGDSYSSGQGNPDRNGTPTVGSQVVCEQTTLILLIQAFREKVIPVIGEAILSVADVVEAVGDFFVNLFTGSDDDEFVHMDPPPAWLEPLAWRSLKSAPAIAAQGAAGLGRGRMITFVSVAQSGAEVVDGLLKPQRKFRPVGQIDEVFEMLRDPRDHRTPPRLQQARSMC